MGLPLIDPGDPNPDDSNMSGQVDRRVQGSVL